MPPPSVAATGRAALAALAALGPAAGCAQLLGLADTTAAPDAGVSASLRYRQALIGTTVIEQPLDLTTASATYVIPDPSAADGLRRVVATAAADTWTAAIPEGPAYPLYTLPTFGLDPSASAPVARSLQLAARGLLATDVHLAHPAPSAVPPNATLDFALTLDTPYAGERMAWYTVGAWSQRDFLPAELPLIGATTFDPPPVPFATATALGGEPLARLIASDVVLALRYAGPTLTGIYVAPSFEQADVAQPLDGAFTAVPADQTLSATLDTTGVAARLAHPQPALDPATVSAGFEMTAAVAASHGSTAGPVLISGAVAPSAATTLATGYGNPFAGRGWTTALALHASATRSYLPPNVNAAVTLTATMTVAAPPPAAGATVALDACLPVTLVLGGAPLLTDGAAITLNRTHPIAFTFITDGATTLYGATLFELDAATGAPTARLILAGDAPSFVIPGELLTAGRHYFLRATCARGGAAAIATGDLSPAPLPLATGAFDGAVFTVTP
jgi:hypothetical protein